MDTRAEWESMGLSVWVDEAAGSVCGDEEGATPPVPRVICLATPCIVFLFSLTLYEIFMILELREGQVWV